jgi:choloylglycine hydrolase
MCTAITYSSGNHYFGRNLDLEYSYQETVTVMPRNKPLTMRSLPALQSHYALIGMAFVVDEVPLYYDAMNEKGLGMAGLNFPGNADYRPVEEGRKNVASFELIPWILGQCGTVAEARRLLSDVNVTDLAFSEALPPSPLHWMIADAKESIVFEQTQQGARVYDNPVGVMTNNPTFDYHMTHLADYMQVSSAAAENRFAPSVDMHAYSRGMGGIGLPGDLSSASRFIKVAFTKMNSLSESTEAESVTQFFKILGSVEQQRGCCRLGEDKDGEPICEITIYSACCNLERGIYYYTTYNNSRITGIDMHKEDLDGTALVCYPLRDTQDIYMEEQTK